jgi:hypothetical protein
MLSALPAFGGAHAVPQDRDDRAMEHHEADRSEHPEYYNNRYYRLGNREGYQDYHRKSRRADAQHRHKYHSDEDRRAHDYGYEQGYGGTRYNRGH